MSKHNHPPTTPKPQNKANISHNEGKFSCGQNDHNNCYQNGNDGIEINLSDDVINHNQNDDSWLENNKDININLDIGLHFMDWLMLIVLVLLVYGCSPAYADNSAFEMQNSENKRVSQFDPPLQGYPQSDTTFDFCRDGENLHSFLAPEDVNSEFLDTLGSGANLEFLHTLGNENRTQKNANGRKQTQTDVDLEFSDTLKNGTFSVPQNKDRVSSEMRPFSNSTFQTQNFKKSDKTEQNYHAKKETLKETVGKKETNIAGNRKQKKLLNSSDNKEEQGVEVFPFLGNSEQKETLLISNSPLYAYCSQNPLRVCVLLQKVGFNPLTNGNKQGYDVISLATTPKNRGAMDFFQSIREKNISQSLPTSNQNKNLSNFYKNNLFIRNTLTDNNSQGYDKALTQELNSGKPYRYLLAFFVPKNCLTSQVKQNHSTKPLTHLQGKTIISKMSKSSTAYDGATLQNTIAFGICRAVSVKTESEPHHPIFNNSVVSTQNLTGGLSNA